MAKERIPIALQNELISVQRHFLAPSVLVVPNFERSSHRHHARSIFPFLFATLFYHFYRRDGAHELPSIGSLPPFSCLLVESHCFQKEIHAQCTQWRYARAGPESWIAERLHMQIEEILKYMSNCSLFRFACMCI